MAASQARIGYGTLLQRGDGGSPEVFNTVAEVTNITPPQPEADDVEVTHMESPNRTKEYIQGLIEQGEVTAELNWIPDNATQDHLTGLLALQAAGTTVNWRIVLPGSILTWAFAGYIKSFQPEIPVDDKMSATLTIKVAGASAFS